MAIQIYDSKSQKKTEFVSLEPGKVKMYLCGPTVYSFLHVGNFRGAIFFNLVRNWLTKRGYDVTFVYNYTDVDDKIIDRAKEENSSALEIAQKYIGEFESDYSALKLGPHSQNPRVTEFMGQIVEFVEGLVAKGKAYEADGDVYFDVHSYAGYGELSHKNLEDLEAGFRIEVNSRKKHSADFALWKKAKEGEPSWPSPWSAGRPGWHIECSAMIKSIFGDSIDIHGGGMDLLFPHHENERAQSEALTGKTFVKYWMHNNMLNFGNQKMSKSLGNVRTGRSFLTEYGPEILKYLMLSAQYRSTLDFSTTAIDNSIAALARFYSALAWAEQAAKSLADAAAVALPTAFKTAIGEAERGIEAALDDDFNTPEALARMFEIVRQFNLLVRTPKQTPEKKSVALAFTAFMRKWGDVMALFQESPHDFLRFLDDRLLEKKTLKRDEIDKMVSDRSDARAKKDFNRADELRAQLTALGISVHDNSSGSDWEVSK
jgi:cysteinyl-tRNA synthetase